MNISIKGYFNSTNPYYMSPIISEEEAIQQAYAINLSVGVPLNYLKSLVSNYSYYDLLTGKSLVNVNLLNIELLGFYKNNAKFYSYYLQGIKRIECINKTIDYQ